MLFEECLLVRSTRMAEEKETDIRKGAMVAGNWAMATFAIVSIGSLCVFHPLSCYRMHFLKSMSIKPPMPEAIR